MSLRLTGMVSGMRPVQGVVRQGSRKGEVWHFISMEINDTSYGKIYSCQLRDNDPAYKEMVTIEKDAFVDEDGKKYDKHVLKSASDYTGHKVKVTVTGLSAGEREIEDKDTETIRKILQIRASITNIQDKGVPQEDED